MPRVSTQGLLGLLPKISHLSRASPVRTGPIWPNFCCERAIGPRRQAPLLVLQHRPHRTYLPGSARADPRFILHYGDMTDATNLIRIVQETQPDEIYNLAAQKPCAGEFRDGRIHRQRRRARHAARCWKRSASSVWSRRRASIRPRPRSSTARSRKSRRARHAVLSALALCRGQALCLLDHGQLSRGLWHARLERHPVQS